MSSLILVIDDNDDDRQIMVTILRHAGYVVVDAPDPLQGLKLARSWRPAVAVVDVAMPGLSGNDVAMAMRADQDLAGARLIAVSAHHEYRGPAERAGFDLFVEKPFAPEMLVDAVDRLLGGEPPRLPLEA